MKIGKFEMDSESFIIAIFAVGLSVAMIIDAIKN